ADSGATVLSSNATIGASTSLGNNNFALITGPSSVWSNRNDFTVGNFSVGNRLVVSNGATVFTGGNGLLGFHFGANSNSATVTGAGSIWSNYLSTSIGSTGSFNQLVVANGAQV